MKNNVHGSPYSVKSSSIQDTSLSNAINIDDLIAKINAKYPTVADSYIRMLLKKYVIYANAIYGNSITNNLF